MYKRQVLEGANYIGIGPVFPSQTKQFDEHIGVQLVETITREIQLPGYAIGGINNENVDELLAVGCQHVAVSNVIVAAKDPSAAAQVMKAKLAPQ